MTYDQELVWDREPAPVECPPAQGEGAARVRLARERLIAARPHLALPALVTVALAFQAGGFFPAVVALLAVLLIALVVGRITLAAAPLAGWTPALAISAGALGLLAAWTLLSATWSHAPFRAMSEFDRTLAYALVLCLMGSFAAQAGDLDRLLKGLAFAACGVAALALLTRLFPGVFPTEGGKDPSRLSFPLTYWNALAVMSAIGLVLAVHATAGGSTGRLGRVLGAGALPVVAVTLYFTFSRGGIAAAALGIVAYVVLAHPRRLPVAAIAAGIPTAIAVATAYAASDLATPDYADATPQSGRVALVVAACAAAAMGLRALGLRVDRRLDAVVLHPRRRRAMLLATAVLAAVSAVAAVTATDIPRRLDAQRREFLHAGPIRESADRRDRLTQLGANGRIEHWRVARKAFERHPWHGTGAGTFRLEWERERPNAFAVVDGHSLYVEMLGELGVPGLLLLAIALTVPLGVAARRLRGPEHHAHAAFLAAALALLVHAGIDWDWEMPAVFAWFPAAAGVVCAARLPARAAPRLGRLTRVTAALGCLVIAVTPASVALSQSPLDRATRAFKAGDCPAATDGALASVEALGSRPEPFELLGYCDIRFGQRLLAVRAMEAAHRRDPDDWQYAYGLAVARALAGEDPRSMAALALRLNPRDHRARALSAAMRGGGPEHWLRAAADAEIPFE